jgi:hypothetical protein
MGEPDALIPVKKKVDWRLGPVFDADAHVDPPYDMWRAHLHSYLKDRAPYIEHGEDCDYIVFEGNKRAFICNNLRRLLRLH